MSNHKGTCRRNKPDRVVPLCYLFIYLFIVHSSTQLHLDEAADVAGDNILPELQQG